MSLPHWAYVAMLAFCLAGTLPLVPAFRLQVLKQPGRLLLTIGLAGTPFLLWDLWATHVGHWWFDGGQTLPWRTAGVIDTRIPPSAAPTPFARLGNIIPLLLAFLLVASGIVLGRARR